MLGRDSCWMHSGAGEGAAPEVGLLRLLLEVEADQGATQVQAGAGAADGVDQERREEGRVDGVQDAGEGDQVDARV